MTRLVISGMIFVVLLILSAVAFYYFYTTKSFVPLLVGLIDWLPAAILLMSLNDLRLLKLKKS